MDAPDAHPLDWHIFSARDFLAVVVGVRQAKVRDPLRRLEDELLDLVEQACG